VTADVPTILCVHQGFELYGSDRTFISSLLGLRERFPGARFDIVLPGAGPLVGALKALGFAPRIETLWVARKADGWLRLGLNMLGFPFAVWRATRRMAGAEVCYINTSVIFDYMVATRFSRTPAVLHVHEIPTGLARRAIAAVIAVARGAVIFNSAATRDAFPTAKETHVVLNGVPDPVVSEPRVPLSQGDGTLRVLMIGRINDWKGQDLLVRAIAALPAEQRKRVTVRLAGAAFAGGPAEAELSALLGELGLSGQVSFEGFVDDPAPLYQWADIVAVPSKKPEPFGLVAVEAMAHARAVVAAGHGGLVEIVLPGETGWLFEPRNTDALAAALVEAMAAPEQVIARGRNGRVRFEAQFAEARYRAELAAVIAARLPGQSASAQP
jgi:glycosyltransferase involved in cell wall biosynthesis